MSRKTRKLIWSAPLVAVLAVIGALAMFAAQGPGSVSANPLPTAPANLTVKTADGDAGRTTLVLSWSAAANASGYRIDKSDQGGVWETVMMDTGSTATTYTDDTLTSDDTRWYRVFAVNSHGIGPVSNAVSGTTDMKVRPGSVMNLRAVPNEKNPRSAIDLTWEAPTSNGGEKIVGYEVQFHNGTDWGPFGATFTANQVSVTTKMELTDSTNLDPGDSRLYRVRAINGPDTVTAGDGVAATTTENTVSKDWVRATGTTSPAMPPGQVTGLTAVNTGTGGDEISLYWYAPEDTGGWNISGYLIQARREGKRFPAIPKDSDLTTTPSTNVTLGSTPTVDNMNRFIGVPAASQTQATFSGVTAIDTTEDNVSNPTQQRWYFRVFALTTDDGPNDATNTDDDVIRRSQSPSNVASDVAATRDIDHDDDAARTDGETVTPALDPLAAPTITPTGTTSAAADGALKQQINLGLALDSDITTNNALTAPQSLANTPVEQIAYRIDYSDDLGVTWKLLERDTRFTGFGANKPYEDDNGLAFDEQRHYRVFAIGRHPYSDVGPASTSAFGWTLVSGPPKKPTGVMASAPSLTSIMASWTAPEDNGGKAIVKYHYQYVLDDDDDVAEDGDFTTNTPVAGTTMDAMTMGTFTVAALTANEVYAFRVAAVNKDANDADRPANAGAVATADWSAPVLFSTSEAAKPNAVEGLTSELATDASGVNRGVNLLWNKPSDMIAITRYEVEVQDDLGDWVSPAGGANVSPSRTSYTDSDEPEAGEMRTYRVRAVNGVGDGPWTMVMYPREPATHSHVATSGTIPAPDPIIAGTSTTVDVKSYFTGAASYSAASSDAMVASTPMTAVDGMVMVTGVGVGTATITVTASDGTGGTATQTFMVTVTAAVVTPPSKVMATAVPAVDPGGTASVTVTWTNGANALTHMVLLFDTSDWSLADTTGPNPASNQDNGETTFIGLGPGTYLAVVVAYDADVNIQLELSNMVIVGGG